MICTVAASYPRVLSTQFTIVFKFVFPTLWLTLMIAVMVGVASMAETHLALLFLAVILLVTALFWFYAWPIKKVVAYRDHLVVSNYLRTIRIAYSEVDSVREVRWINWRPTVVTLKHPSPFGVKLLYYPTVDSLFSGRGTERSATKFLRDHLT